MRVNISTQVQPHEHLSRLQHHHCNPSPIWTRSYTDDFHLNSFFVLLRQAGSFLLSIIISRVSEPQCAHVYMRVVLDHPRWGVHLLVVLMGLTTTPCIVVASVIAYRMYKQPLPQSRVPSCRNWRSSPLGSTSGLNTSTIVIIIQQCSLDQSFSNHLATSRQQDVYMLPSADCLFTYADLDIPSDVTSLN